MSSVLNRIRDTLNGLKDGEVKIGDHIRVSKKSFDRWLEQMTA